MALLRIVMVVSAALIIVPAEVLAQGHVTLGGCGGELVNGVHRADRAGPGARVDRGRRADVRVR